MARTKGADKAAKNPRSGRPLDLGTIRRLKDQLVVQKAVKAIHENRRKLDERAFYPAHDLRKESKEYAKVHKNLVVELDLPCLVCGVRHSTLKNKKKNTYGAKQLETHHHMIEWALANAIDVDKFNNTILPHLNHRHPQKQEYQKPFTQEQVAAWVDHSEDNLWVLCDVHHRAKYFGIHEITYPIWCPMDLLRPDFEKYVKEQIAAEKAGSRATRTRRVAAAPAHKRGKAKSKKLSGR